MIKQRHWRATGALAILLCAAMALSSVSMDWAEKSALYMAGYWGIFVLAFAVAVYSAMLDLRYIRAQYAIARREVFLQTLGDESFRKELRRARTAEANQESSEQ